MKYNRWKSTQKRSKKPTYTFVCELCGQGLNWHVPRKEGVFCENCAATIFKAGDTNEKEKQKTKKVCKQ